MMKSCHANFSSILPPRCPKEMKYTAHASWFVWKIKLMNPFCQQYHLTLIRAAGGVYDFRNFEEV